MSKASFESLRSAVVARFPDLARANFSWLPPGFDSLAIDVDDRLIFKFPRDEPAAARLKAEASLLTVIRPAVTMPVPDLAVFPGPPPFSRHTKLKGGHLLAADYAGLPSSAQQDLAGAMAGFYAELHSLDTASPHFSYPWSGEGPKLQT
jgi:aminoglycoside phosphotransferase (APT) family kinase protein